MSLYRVETHSSSQYLVKKQRTDFNRCHTWVVKSTVDGDICISDTKMGEEITIDIDVAESVLGCALDLMRELKGG